MPAVKSTDIIIIIIIIIIGRSKSIYRLEIGDQFDHSDRYWELTRHDKQYTIKELDDSAFLRTQSYITEICYFEFL